MRYLDFKLSVLRCSFMENVSRVKIQTKGGGNPQSANLIPPPVPHALYLDEGMKCKFPLPPMGTCK